VHAAAEACGLPLWPLQVAVTPVRLPLPEVQIFGGGAHARRRIDIQDLMVMPIGAQSFDEALAMVADVYLRRVNRWPRRAGSRRSGRRGWVVASRCSWTRRPCRR
jgi:enolase